MLRSLRHRGVDLNDPKSRKFRCPQPRVGRRSGRIRPKEGAFRDRQRTSIEKRRRREDLEPSVPGKVLRGSLARRRGQGAKIAERREQLRAFCQHTVRGVDPLLTSVRRPVAYGCSPEKAMLHGQARIPRERLFVKVRVADDPALPDILCRRADKVPEDLDSGPVPPFGGVRVDPPWTAAWERMPDPISLATSQQECLTKRASPRARTDAPSNLCSGVECRGKGPVFRGAASGRAHVTELRRFECGPPFAIHGPAVGQGTREGRSAPLRARQSPHANPKRDGRCTGSSSCRS